VNEPRIFTSGISVGPDGGVNLKASANKNLGGGTAPSLGNINKDDKDVLPLGGQDEDSCSVGRPSKSQDRRKEGKGKRKLGRLPSPFK